MFKATNSRGLSSLSNEISSASDLPPLNPSSGSVYQPPNSTGSRNALIETQRMRTAVMGQIQAVQSDQDRQIQQSETRMSMVLRELTPKIQNLDRHNSFNQQQLDDLVERLSQLDSVIVPAIQQKCDEVQLKFEQSIRTETQSKFKPFSDDIKHEQSKSDNLSDSATTCVTSTNDKLKELSHLYNSFESQVSEAHSYVQNHIMNINPRLSTIETKLTAYETAAEISKKNQSNHSDFQRSTKKLRKDLEDLENDGIPLAIQSAESEMLAHITSISSQIEQKFTTSKLTFTNMENAIKVTTEQQKNIDLQLESLSKSSLDIQASIGQKEQEVNNKLTEIENSIKSINDEISGTLSELQDNNSGDSRFALEALNDDIKSLQTSAKQHLTQLNQDWLRFHKDNGEAQKITDTEIDNISSILNGEMSLLNKIAAAEEGTKWCLNRLQVWQKEAKEAENRNVDDEKLIRKLETLEAQLNEAESRLAAIDKKSAPKPKKITKEKFNKIKKAPSEPKDGEEIEPLSIPTELKLTYDENDAKIVIPDFPSHEERRKKAKDQSGIKQPEVNPTNDDDKQNEEGGKKDEKTKNKKSKKKIASKPDKSNKNDKKENKNDKKADDDGDDDNNNGSDDDNNNGSDDDNNNGSDDDNNNGSDDDNNNGSDDDNNNGSDDDNNNGSDDDNNNGSDDDNNNGSDDDNNNGSDDDNNNGSDDDNNNGSDDDNNNSSDSDDDGKKD